MKHHNVEPAVTAVPQTPHEQADPATVVTELLTAAGHPNPSAWLQYLPADYAAAPSVGHKVFLVNRAWRLILGSVPDTSDVRYCLVETDRVADWQRSFEQGVIPCAVKHNLPLVKS